VRCLKLIKPATYCKQILFAGIVLASVKSVFLGAPLRLNQPQPLHILYCVSGLMSALFSALDRKQKLYQRKTNAYVAKQISARLSLPLVAQAQHSPQKALPYNISLQELAEKPLLQQVIQASILVTQKGDILYLHGRTGMYLEPVTGGLKSYNIIKMAQEGLQPELIVALHKAATDNVMVHRLGLRVKTNGDFSSVNLSVSPVTAGLTVSSASTLFMVVP